MADGPFDFAVLGSNPLALLLAGLLAGVHKKSVALVVETHSSFRLTRGFDLSVGPITRPETWALLANTVPEVRKLLASFGAKAAIERIDPLMVAETEAGSEALLHVRHLLLAHSIPIERLTADGAGDHLPRPGRAAPPPLAARRARSQSGSSATRSTASPPTASPSPCVATARASSAATKGSRSTQVIAADDNAILAHLEAGEREKLLRVDSATTVLTEPMKSLPAPMTLVVDRGFALLQRKGGMVQALAAGGADTAARMGTRLSGTGRIRRAGQTGFGALVPIDGAPLIGPVKSLKASVVSGFGPPAAFLAPAIARYFAGAATPEEQAYFTARESAKDGRQSVSEFAGAMTLGSAS